MKQVIKENPIADIRMVFQDPYKRISKKVKQPMLNGVSVTVFVGVPPIVYQWIG